MDAPTSKLRNPYDNWGVRYMCFSAQQYRNTLRSQQAFQAKWRPICPEMCYTREQAERYRQQDRELAHGFHEHIMRAITQQKIKAAL